ncbi:VOC family protein [Arenimonas sp. MALMAid1274]|uniref:VOC family protein n=1 Tax=Arenimonas sp. MALMAid1274 TaxID=3411630 RepID=UPI003BA3BFE8
MKISPYLNFDGRCEAAMRRYAEVLGGQIVAMMPYAGSPMADEGECDFPDGFAGKVMHACLQVGDQMIMGADAPPQYFEKPQGTSVSLHIDDPAEAERVFAALMEGESRITLPIQPTFWALRFGSGVDRFGTPWMINCSDPAVQA